MHWPWISRRAHETAVAEVEADALLALTMSFADRDPHGWDWTVRARTLWAEAKGL